MQVSAQQTAFQIECLMLPRRHQFGVIVVTPATRVRLSWLLILSRALRFAVTLYYARHFHCLRMMTSRGLFFNLSLTWRCCTNFSLLGLPAGSDRSSLLGSCYHIAYPQDNKLSPRWVLLLDHHRGSGDCVASSWTFGSVLRLRGINLYGAKFQLPEMCQHGQTEFQNDSFFCHPVTLVICNIGGMETVLALDALHGSKHSYTYLESCISSKGQLSVPLYFCVCG